MMNTILMKVNSKALSGMDQSCKLERQEAPTMEKAHLAMIKLSVMWGWSCRQL
jgi:hypothetical protein